MRVLLLSWEHPPVVVGGLGRHVQELAKALVELGHEVVVLSRGPMGQVGAAAQSWHDGVRVVTVAEDPLCLQFGRDLVAWTLSLGHAMLRSGLDLVSSFQPDVVHAHDWLVAAPAIALAEHLQVPLVTTVHATEAGRHDGWIGEPINAQVHSAERWLVRSSDALICCAESMRQEVNTLFGPLQDEPVVIPNGIDVKEWLFQPPDRCATPPRLLFLGRLEYEKGVHDLIAALPAIRQEHPGTTLSVVGAGTQNEWLHEVVHEHKTAGAVRFFGELGHAEIRRHMRVSSALVVPSRYEPFGLVALEGAAAGIPLVASTAGGLGEAVVENVTGRSFAPGDVAALAEAVGRSLAAPTRSARLAKAARERITSEFAWSSVAERTAQVYQTTKRRTDRAPLSQPELHLPARLFPRSPATQAKQDQSEAKAGMERGNEMTDLHKPPQFKGAVALVTGASRGIGAETARQLAANGATVIVNYREKRKRADAVVAEIEERGGTAVALGADVTDEDSRASLFAEVEERFGKLDLLVLNASGGLEPGAAPDYAMAINRDSQVRLLEQALPIMPEGSRIVFVTSHQAHFYPKKPVPEPYVPIAESKQAGESEIRARVPILEERGVSLVVVSGDMIEGTTMVMLLGRRNPEEIDARKQAAGALPTIEEFAAEIVAEAAATVPSGHTRYVGGEDFLAS